MVEIAYSRPATAPASSTDASCSRVAHGDTAPSSSSGTATSTSVPNSEAANAPTDTSSNALTLNDRNGCAMNGMTASSARPQHRACTARASTGAGRASTPPSL